jgi:hypothetical protein
MFLIDDLNNLNTGSDGYEPGQQFSNSYKDNPLNDDDSYTSINPNYNIELDDDDAYPSVNPRPSSQFEDSGYESANKDNFSDPEFQNYYKGQQRGGLMDQARRAVKRGRATVQRTIPKKIGEDLLGDKQAFMDSSPENRERVKELAKERARNALSDNIGDGLGKGFKEGIKKGAKGIAKDGLSEAGKVAKGAKNVATAAKGAKNVATAAEGLEGAIALVGAASGPETLGLGTIAAFLLDIAISLGIEDAVDCLFELKEGNIGKAKFHAEKAYMSVQMFVWFLIGIVFSISVTGFIIGVPIMVALTIYALLGIIFPGVGLLQGLSRNWELAILFIVDLFLFIIVLTFVAGVLWYICDQSGLGGGNAAALISKVIDWWNGRLSTHQC